jgi:hypothetical protein
MKKVEVEVKVEREGCWRMETFRKVKAEWDLEAIGKDYRVVAERGNPESRSGSVRFLEVRLAENTYNINPCPGPYEYNTIVSCSQSVYVVLEAL